MKKDQNKALFKFFLMFLFEAFLPSRAELTSRDHVDFKLHLKVGASTTTRKRFVSNLNNERKP